MNDFSAIERSCQRATRALTEWSRRDLPRDLEGHVREILEFAPACCEATRSRLIWEDTEEPWIFISEIGSEGNLTTRQEIYSVYTPVVVDSIPPVAFRTSPGNLIFVTGEETPRDLSPEDAFNRNVAPDYDLSSVLVIPIESSPLSGHLLLEIPPEESVILHIVSMIGALAGGRLDHMEALVSASLSEVQTRVKQIARDLHDGVLQSFTGVVLQLETVHQLIDENPEQAKPLITQLQSVLMEEQRDLRSYLERMKPKARVSEAEFDLRERLEELTRRYESEWGISLTFDDSGVDPTILAAIGWETYRILSEAITNAARHGNANNIRATMVTQGDLLRIVVEDDGDGFGFRGKCGMAELIEKQAGPVSLIERVSGLNGTIEVESTDKGSTITATVPVGWGR